MVRLILPSSGQVIYRGQDVAGLGSAGRLAFRQGVQMVFQDTHSSLNPRKRIRRTLREALGARNISGGAANIAIEQLMQQVGLDLPLLDRLPHELSGGQRQRVGIARALAMAPDILVADEPVSSLDVSLQGQIINLLQEINRSLGLTIILISHDLAVVARVCSALAVMNKGRVVEMGAPSQVLVHPEHAYTRALLASVPRGLESRRSKGVLPQRVA
jgi:ABC-type glutathione transport system ATPase component